MGSFLFLGPTGVGKTLVARVVAAALFGGAKSLLRFDMSEYAEKHAMARLFGAPPGYVGHEAGGQLTEAVRAAPFSVVLLDEIEKAHPDVHSTLLQVLDDGRLTDGTGAQVDFRHCLLILTSNLGARLMERTSTLGFAPAAGEWPARAMREEVMGEVRRAFNPEFINRLDEIVLFKPLGDEELRQVVRLLFDELSVRLAERGVRAEIDEAAIAWLVDCTAQERRFGARPLRRALERLVADWLAEGLLRGLVAGQEPVRIGAGDEGLVFRQGGRTLPLHDGPAQ
jgi:ATP-dependent Clp protease ATP-binding subunit ClpC